MTKPVDVVAIREKWLQQCGSCDGGLPMGCTHPDEDYRPVMAALADALEAAHERIEELTVADSNRQVGMTTECARRFWAAQFLGEAAQRWWCVLPPGHDGRHGWPNGDLDMSTYVDDADRESAGNRLDAPVGAVSGRVEEQGAQQ